jgi:hypothetical protein
MEYEKNKQTKQGHDKSEFESLEANDVVIAEEQARHRILASKTWTWNVIRRGDCTIEAGARFTLYSDGSTRWVCDISSTDSGDEWDGRFRITNAGGTVLFDTDRYHFDISQANVKKRWDEPRGPRDDFARQFNEAQGNSFFCNC